MSLNQKTTSAGKENSMLWGLHFTYSFSHFSLKTQNENRECEKGIKETELLIFYEALKTLQDMPWVKICHRNIRPTAIIWFFQGTPCLQ